MDINELKKRYADLLQPIFREQLRIEDSEEDRDWVVFILDGAQEEFDFSLYGTDCVHLYWCNECFIFDLHRNDLVSSDTYGEIVFEGDLDAEELPNIVVDLILHLKDCVFLSKTERVQGKTPSGYDKIKTYAITARAKKLPQAQYRLSHITINYMP